MPFNLISNLETLALVLFHGGDADVLGADVLGRAVLSHRVRRDDRFEFDRRPIRRRCSGRS